MYIKLYLLINASQPGNTILWNHCASNNANSNYPKYHENPVVKWNKCHFLAQKYSEKATLLYLQAALRYLSA